jgi:hypothetical protein
LSIPTLRASIVVYQLPAEHHQLAAQTTGLAAGRHSAMCQNAAAVSQPRNSAAGGYRPYRFLESSRRKRPQLTPAIDVNKSIDPNITIIKLSRVMKLVSYARFGVVDQR